MKPICVKGVAKAFIAGSALPATIVSMTYIGLARQRRPSAIPNYEFTPMKLMLLFGIANILVTNFGRTHRSAAYMTVFGMVFGLLLSIYGASQDMPAKLFGLGGTNKFFVHIVAPVIYGAVWGILVYGSNTVVGI